MSRASAEARNLRALATVRPRRSAVVNPVHAVVDPVHAVVQPSSFRRAERFLLAFLFG